MLFTNKIALGPLTLIIDIAPILNDVDIAHIVSSIVFFPFQFKIL